MKRTVIIFLGLIFFLGCAAETKTSGTVNLPDGEKINVEIADQLNEKKQGLAGREKLAEGEGMLFVFDQDDYPGIWMKGMKFSIDIIFINDQEIVHIVHAAPVSPDSNYPTWRPASPANYVLEVPAGYCQKHQLEKGDKVEIKY